MLKRETLTAVWRLPWSMVDGTVLYSSACYNDQCTVNQYTAVTYYYCRSYSITISIKHRPEGNELQVLVQYTMRMASGMDPWRMGMVVAD